MSVASMDANTLRQRDFPLLTFHADNPCVGFVLLIFRVVVDDVPNLVLSFTLSEIVLIRSHDFNIFEVKRSTKENELIDYSS